MRMVRLGAMVALAIVCSWLSFGEAQAQNEDLAEGIRLYDALEYEPAQALLEKALQTEGTSRKELAQAALYLGVVRVALGDQETGSTWFTVALAYDADVQIPEGTSPKIRTLFDELAAKLIFARPSEASAVTTNKVINAPKTPAIDALVNERPVQQGREESRFWTYAAAGSTVVAAGLAMTFGVMAYSTASDIESGPHERAALRDLQDDLDLQGNLANTFLGVTGVLAATTAIVYLVQGRKKKGTEEPGIAISVSGSADGAVVGTWFSF